MPKLFHVSGIIFPILRKRKLQFKSGNLFQATVEIKSRAGIHFCSYSWALNC